MKYLFTFSSLLFFIVSTGQNMRAYVNDSILISRSFKSFIELKPPTVDSAIQPALLPFGSFIVKDVRADTSYLGIKIKKSAMTNSTSYEKVMLKKGTALPLMNYLNTNPRFQFAANTLLTLFLKKLRITEVDSLNKTTNNKELYRLVTFEAEGYMAKENLYYPALRMDTTLLSATAEKNDFSILADVLNLFAAKAGIIDTDKVFKRIGYTGQVLDERYQQRFNQPILVARQLKIGVYKTFGEFVNNQPSLQQYKFKTDRKSSMLYVQSQGDELMPGKNAFGFCDGKVIWIRINNVYHPIVRQGNTFEFLSFYHVHQRNVVSFVGSPYSPITAFGTGMLSAAISGALTDDAGIKMLYQLNMENGEYY